MNHRCVPRQVLPYNPRYEGCTVWSFAICSKEACRFFGTGDVSFDQGAPDNAIYGMMTQRTTISLPTHKAVMALRPKPVAALALMGGTQGQTKAEANRNPDCLIAEGKATHSNRKRHYPVRRMRAAYRGESGLVHQPNSGKIYFRLILLN